MLSDAACVPAPTAFPMKALFQRAPKLLEIIFRVWEIF